MQKGDISQMSSFHSKKNRNNSNVTNTKFQREDSKDMSVGDRDSLGFSPPRDGTELVGDNEFSMQRIGT